MGALQPVLVLPVYRGGEKFARALESVRGCENYFRRLVVSLNGPAGSPDELLLLDYLRQGPTKIEYLHTGEELPWMEHQYFWLDFLERTGESPTSWVYWFAHDDQLWPAGIRRITDPQGNWPLEPRTVYMGPWGVRYDPPGALYAGPSDADIESWTSFPLTGPLRMTIGRWIAAQLKQPTYINMSGSITQLSSFRGLKDFWFTKPGGMRIEMATALASNNTYIEELPCPTVITYTSPSTDRTQYAATARKDDVHLALYASRYITRHPSSFRHFSFSAMGVLRSKARELLGRGGQTQEEWRRRETLSHSYPPMTSS